MYDIKYLTIAKNKHCGNTPPFQISTIKSELIKGKMPTQKIDTHLINQIFHWSMWIFDFIKFQLRYTSQQFCEKSGFHRLPTNLRHLGNLAFFAQIRHQGKIFNGRIGRSEVRFQSNCLVVVETKTGSYIVLGGLLLAF